MLSMEWESQCWKGHRNTNRMAHLQFVCQQNTKSVSINSTRSWYKIWWWCKNNQCSHFSPFNLCLSIRYYKGMSPYFCIPGGWGEEKMKTKDEFKTCKANTMAAQPVSGDGSYSMSKAVCLWPTWIQPQDKSYPRISTSIFYPLHIRFSVVVWHYT